MKANLVSTDRAVHFQNREPTGFFSVLLRSVNALIARTGGVSFKAFGPFPSYTKAQVLTLTPADYARCIVYVSDGDSDRHAAISNGSAWYYLDGTAVS